MIFYSYSVANKHYVFIKILSQAFGKQISNIFGPNSLWLESPQDIQLCFHSIEKYLVSYAHELDTSNYNLTIGTHVTCVSFKYDYAGNGFTYLKVYNEEHEMAIFDLRGKEKGLTAAEISVNSSIVQVLFNVNFSG